MFANLKNTGIGTRVVYDVRNRERVIPPGHDIAVELPEKAAIKIREAAKKGDTLAIRFLGDNGDDPEVDTRDETFTLGEGEGAPPIGEPSQHPQMQTPKNLNEINNGPGLQQRYHGGPTNQPKGTPNAPVEEPPPPSPHNPIEHQAAQAAAAASQPKVETEQMRDPMTAMELIQREAEYSVEQLRAHAVRILPKDALQIRSSKSQIMNALQKEAKKAPARVDLQG